MVLRQALVQEGLDCARGCIFPGGCICWRPRSGRDDVSVASWWLLRKGYALIVSCEYALFIHAMRFSDYRVRLSYLMDHFRTAEATDARDKVNAFLGFLSPSAREHHLLQPDYSKLIVDVYLNAFRYMISTQSGENGEFLRDLIGSISQPPDEVNEDFPSWMPRFDVPVLDTGLLHTYSAKFNLSPPMVTDHVDKRVLVLKGAKISTVKVTDYALCIQQLEDLHLKKLWETIVKCMGTTNHPNTLEAEAKAAIHLASRLMGRYNVSQAEVLAHEGPFYSEAIY